jgi:hypothetical protein
MPTTERLDIAASKKAPARERNLTLLEPAVGYAARDCGFLALIILVSSVFYVSRLGFYWDDWQVLKIFRFSEDQSIIGLTRSVFRAWPEMLVRPMQALQWAALYPLFGLNPLGYHLVSTAVLAAGVCAFYLVLRAFTGRRLISLGAAVVFGLLPHYSTDRFWYAIWAASFGMLFYFLSLYGDLKQLETGRSWIWPWKVIGSVCLIIGSLAYELFMPLFLLNPALIALKRLQLKAAGKTVHWGWIGSALFYSANPILLVLISIFKRRMSARAPTSGEFGWWLVDNTLDSSVDLTFRAYGFNLPHILSIVWTRYWNWTAFVIALTVAIGIAAYLAQVARVSREQPPRAAVLGLIVIGATFLSGMSYAYLYSFYEVNTGVNNRVALAAAVTVAIAWVSLAALLSLVVFRRTVAANYTFCVIVAALCGYGCLLNNTISSFWIAASQQQVQVLKDMKQHFPSPAPNSSILLAGLCAWTGPGIIFEARWDLTGALALTYGDNSLKGEPMWPWLTATEDGIPSGPDTSHKTIVYPFSSLYLYDVQNKEALRITDAKTASDYIAKSSHFNEEHKGCLTAGFGTGLAIW